MHIEQCALTDELKQQIYDGFSRHAIATTGHNKKFNSIAFTAMEGSRFVGAIVIEPFWGALHIKYLYVEEDERGKGIATRLMEYALAYGKEQQFSFAFVETMSFQALGFYQKQGFELEFTRSGYAQGTSLHYLRKDFIGRDT